jgi:Fe-S-cluster-containing dehydrogenase component
MSESAKKKWGMVINTRRCFDCKACMIACKVENQLPEGHWRNWVLNDEEISGRRTTFQPGQCMQCNAPSCVAACPVGATSKREDGIVTIDPVRCIGCGNCVTACPYGARYVHPQKHLADKCDFCSHRLAQGETPACVETCPTKARAFGDLNDPDSDAAKLLQSAETVRIIAPHIDTKPNIYYIKGTPLLDWATLPSLPGNAHMPSGFWRSYE